MKKINLLALSPLFKRPVGDDLILKCKAEQPNSSRGILTM